VDGSAGSLLESLAQAVEALLEFRSPPHQAYSCGRPPNCQL
jgi:hypothetical protein